VSEVGAGKWRGLVRFLLASAAAVLLAPGAARAQVAVQPAAVDVFLDCQASGCDTQHFRNEITFVNWVRDRTVADVHVLITSQGSGGGGTVYQLSFIGLRRFAGDTTTLSMTTAQGLTEAERRDLLTNRLAQGLVGYAASSTAADRIRIEYDAGGDDGAGAAAPLDDPWNFWVFRLNLDGSVDGEARDESREVEFRANASRVTPAWKFEVETEGSYEWERFELRDGERIFVTKNWQVDALVTQALAPHWSAGFTTETGTSTFENQDLYVRPAAMLEYSYYPYTEYSRRRILVQYSLGARHFDYEERTIYGRLQEMRYDQRLEVSAQFQQPWGSAEAELSGQHYLHNIDRYSIQTRAGFNVRLFRGFGLNFDVNYARVHDQLYIPAGDADDEDILLRRRELETNYRYGASVGLSYTFGSVYNNVVNPRIGGVNSF